MLLLRHLYYYIAINSYAYDNILNCEVLHHEYSNNSDHLGVSCQLNVECQLTEGDAYSTQITHCRPKWENDDFRRAYLQSLQSALAKLPVMLVSPCGEYPCECKNLYSRQIRQIVANIWRMGLRMQFATNRNDCKMIARYSYVFVSIRGRSCGVANIMLLSHCGEYLANVKHLYSRHIRQK